MLQLVPDRDTRTPLRVLCLGAHSDDIEIGCAGTLLRLAAGPAPLDVRWVVFSARDEREREARESARRLLEGAADLRIDVLDFRDGFFPDSWAAVKEAFEDLKVESPGPELVFTHYRRDLHQDHRTVSQLTWNTFRDHLILEYEVPKWDGDLGRPNLFVPLGAELARRKARHLVESFPSQREKPWFGEDTFLALSRLRGVESAAEHGHAEAFHMRKAVLGV